MYNCAFEIFYIICAKLFPNIVGNIISEKQWPVLD